MDREGFRNRLNQYKKAREETPGLKYWEWKAIPKYDEGTDGIRDNTYVAPIEKELVFIPATGSTKLKLDVLRNLTRNGQIKSGAVDIVSPEFEILTVAAGPIKKATSKLLLNATNKIDDSLKYSGRFSQPSTNDKLYEIYNSKLANIGSFEDYKNYVATIFPDSKLKDVYYHGGAKNIKLFKDFGDAVTTSNVGAKHGIYFTPQKEYAQHTRGQRVLSVDADNKQRSIISSLKTRYTPGKLDKLIEDETELYEVLLNSLNPLITKGNWTWAIDDKKYGELLEKGYDAVENKGQSLFLNINRLPETIVWDTLNIHILGNAEDIAGFEKYLKGYADGGEVEPDPLEVLERSKPKFHGMPLAKGNINGVFSPIDVPLTTLPKVWPVVNKWLPNYGQMLGALVGGNDGLTVNRRVKPLATKLIDADVKEHYEDIVIPLRPLEDYIKQIYLQNPDNFVYNVYVDNALPDNRLADFNNATGEVRIKESILNSPISSQILAHEINGHRSDRSLPRSKEAKATIDNAFNVRKKPLSKESKLLAEKEAETTRLSYNFYKYMKDNGLLQVKKPMAKTKAYQDYVLNATDDQIDAMLGNSTVYSRDYKASGIDYDKVRWALAYAPEIAAGLIIPQHLLSNDKESKQWI